MKIEIEKVIVTTAISSASGLAFDGNKIWIAGDDAAYVIKSSLDGSEFTRIKLYENATEQRLRKPVKHDLEACVLCEVLGEPHLFLFGSGSLSPYRDTLFVLNIKNTNLCLKRSMAQLYDAIRKKAALKKNELNLEGAALVGDQLVLFNRGKNFIVLMRWKKFVLYAMNELMNDVPAFTIINIELPVVNGFRIGFSGACALNENELLFTATLEETSDSINDGPVKGSYIGLLNLKNNTAANVVSLLQIKNADGNILTDKLEAIETIKISGKSISAIAVADNDDGESKLFYLTINLSA